MIRTTAAVGILLICTQATADDQAERVRAALTQHEASLVRVEATTFTQVERLPGLTKGTRRSQHVSSPGIVVDDKGLVAFPTRMLDPSSDVFALLGSAARADVLEISVVGQDGRIREATWLGRSPEAGLSFVRVNEVGRQGLQPVSWSDAVPQVGDPLVVLSLGPASLGRPATAECARVSFRSEALLGISPRMPQALGALVVDAAGGAVGMLGSPAQRGGGAQGDLLRPDLLAQARAGYLIPAAALKPQLSAPPQEAGSAAAKRERPWLGAKLVLLTEELAADHKLDVDVGVLVLAVYPDSPAAKAKLQPNDVLLEMDGLPLDLDPGERLQDLILDYRPGEQVPFKVRRGDKTIDVVVTLEAGPVTPARAERVSVPEAGILVRALTFFDRRELQLPDDLTGVVVVELAPDGPGSRAGLRPGDVLLSIGGEALGGLQDARERLAAEGTHELKLRRRDQELTLTLRR